MVTIINRYDKAQPLKPGDVHVWTASLDCSQDELHEFYAILSDAEQGRADRYYFKQDQKKYIIRHGLLRHLLSGYLDTDPETLQFAQSSFGKPYLIHYPDLKFSLSYSNCMGLFAFGYHNSLGADTEFIKYVPNMNDLVKYCFSMNEQKILNSDTDSAKDQSFYKFWTRKEAIVKGMGTGLNYPIHRISVSLEALQQVHLSELHKDQNAIQTWSLYELNLPPNYEGALATEKCVQDIVYFNGSENPEIYND